MPRAQCYYEILGVEETASGDEIKKAYRNLALVWHPDKNQANPEEAHARFQVILKAYETLSDSREREWYDRHKDQILSDGSKDNVEECINLFQYFSSSCYANFDDSEDGFYTVYRNVFDELAKEEEKALEQMAKYVKPKSKAEANNKTKPINSFPGFGSSTSSYEEVVRPFYAFWSGFCTSLTFDHLDKYNTLEAENRRILRAMEKENKKVKDAARKERNTNVRNLVEFIKKRDRRLKAHKLLVEQQNELNRQKTAEKQRQQREKSLKETSQYKPASWQDMDDFEEQLRQLESEYDDLKKPRKGGRANTKYDDSEDELDDDAGEELDDGAQEQELDANNGVGQPGNDVDRLGGEIDDDDDNDEDEEEEEAFFCPACNKDFRTINAFENHENSKKHKQNVLKLTKLLKDEENKLMNK